MSNMTPCLKAHQFLYLVLPTLRLYSTTTYMHRNCVVGLNINCSELTLSAMIFQLQPLHNWFMHRTRFLSSLNTQLDFNLPRATWNWLVNFKALFHRTINNRPPVVFTRKIRVRFVVQWPLCYQVVNLNWTDGSSPDLVPSCLDSVLFWHNTFDIYNMLYSV